MRRRLINCIDALLVGMILGLIFVTFVHASPGSPATHKPITTLTICRR